MPILVSCGACRKQFTVPDHYAGKSGKCTQCGATILAPASPIKTGSDEQLVAFGEPAATGPRPSVSIGSELAGCKLQKRLGSEKSTVFLALGPKGPVAIKVLPREMTEKTPVAAKRFLREARALFNLEHPNVATCLDAGEELGTLYMVLELFGGRTVKELMAERGGKVPTTEALGIALQVARGLEFFNEQKLVHRNVKPEHILVDGEGHAKLVGLGLVKSEDSDQAVTMKGVAVGTPQYLALTIDGFVAGGKLCPVESGKVLVEESVDLEAVATADRRDRWSFESDVNGICTEVKDLAFKVHYENGVKGMNAVIVCDEEPKVRVHGSAFGVLPTWAIDVVIPGNMEELTRSFFHVVTRGNGGKGMVIRADTRISANSGVSVFDLDGEAEGLNNFLVRLGFKLARKKLIPPDDAIDDLAHYLRDGHAALTKDIEEFATGVK